jgi:penicillin-binding protein 2
MDSTFASPAIGYQKWWDMMSQLGYGKKLGIDLYGEKKGNLPSVKYYNKIFGEGKWKASTIISNSIGQGEVLATPLQIANAMAIIANKGYYYSPRVGRSLIKEHQKLNITKQKITTNIDTVFYRYVIDGLEKVVLEGTARGAKIPDISFCGKTGTAQNPHGKDHSIFSGFAPKENPKIAIAVFVENAGFGATYAAPIASLMVEKYLHDTIATKRIPLQERMFKARIISDDLEVGIPKTPQQLRQDSLAKEKSKKDRIQAIADSIKTTKEKKEKESTKNFKPNDAIVKPKEGDIFQE